MQNAVFWLAAGIVIPSAIVSLFCAALFLGKLRIPTSGPLAGIALVLPATGPLENLENLLDALGRQSVRARRLIIAVEAPDDPAYRRATELAKIHREPAIDVVVAGVSNCRGQKCTNIFAALTRLTDEDRYVIMLDADIRPQPWWLAALVAPLAAGGADLVNGYRWLVPEPPTPVSILVAHIDHALAVLPRLPRAEMVWGGSLALTREALEILDLARTLDREVVEDAPIGRRVAETGLRLLTRRALRVPTPLAASWRELWAFGRRQGQFVRLYYPRLWCSACLVTTADFLARVMLVWSLATGSLPALAVLAFIAASDSIATELRRAVGRRIGAGDGLASACYQHLLTLAILPIGACYASMIWASAFTSVVRWAHVQYWLDRSGRVLAVRRHPYGPRRREV